jgi:ribosomal protein S7
MSYFFFYKNYENLKKKSNYNINNIIILSMILGNLTKKGKKNLSYFFLINILFFLKKENIENPLLALNYRLNMIKPTILLYNKKKGTVIFELPRFLTIEQSTKKSVE